eukprot:g3578.t1
MMAQSLWLDCDPGHDDALAIILAGHDHRVRLLGISTVSGNQSVAKTTLNAAKVLVAAGLADAVRVTAGQAQPLLREAKHDAEIHGDSGLGGTDLLPADSAIPEGLIDGDGKGVIAMAEAILASDTPVSVVATGALTNVALMLQLYPEAKPKIREVAFMGGAMGAGNRGAVAEFNILCDPHAAQAVMDSGVKLVMVPLEVTHTALATPEVLREIEALESKFGKLVVQLLTFFRDTYERVFGFKAGPPLHDPCAVAWVLEPALFETTLMRVDVECCSELSVGQTVCDIWGDSQKPKNVHVARTMDVPAFWRLMLDALRAANAASPMGNAAGSGAERA